MRYTVTFAAIVLIAGCGETATTDDVHPAIVDMVDTLEADRDCAGLQAAFDRADDADDLQYIDDALRTAGCYD